MAIIDGTDQDDTLLGTFEPDTIRGFAGNDTLIGTPVAIDLDGSGDRVTVPDSASLDISGNITVEAWIRLDGAQPQFSTVVSKGDWAYQIRMSDTVAGAIEFVTGYTGAAEGSGLATISTTLLSTGVWYHVAGVVNGNQQLVYIDGQLEASSARASTSVGINNRELWIGANDEMSDRDFNGAIADVRVWSVARSTSQIAGAMHTRLTGNETALQANWLLDSSLGAFGTDYSPNGNDGQVAGNPTSTDGTSTEADTLFGGAGNDTLIGGLGNDILNGGIGADTAAYNSATAGVKVNLLIAGEQNTLGAGKDTLTRIENVTGSAFADALTGNNGANVLDGGAGDDTLEGGGGDDTLAGGSDTDTASYASATTGVKVSLLLATRQNTLGAGKDILTGIDNLIGSAFADILTGEGGVNVLTGGLGDDVLDGNAGGDTLIGGAGLDAASYASAAAGVTASLANAAVNTGNAAGDSYTSIENLIGSRHADTLTGTGSANTLNGGKGGDDIDGGGGSDRLLGGGGQDTLTGGGGSDTFVFDQTLAAGNIATIVDFTHGTDFMALSLAVFTAAGPAGALAASAFRIGAAAADADDRIIYNSVTGRLFYDADGTGGVAARSFAIVTTDLGLTGSDFTLV